VRPAGAGLRNVWFRPWVGFSVSLYKPGRRDRRGIGSGARGVKRSDTYCDPWSEWWTSPGFSRRRAIAASSASTTSSTSRSGRIDQPTIRRERSGDSPRRSRGSARAARRRQDPGRTAAGAPRRENQSGRHPAADTAARGDDRPSPPRSSEGSSPRLALPAPSGDVRVLLVRARSRGRDGAGTAFAHSIRGVSIPLRRELPQSARGSCRSPGHTEANAAFVPGIYGGDPNEWWSRADRRGSRRRGVAARVARLAQRLGGGPRPATRSPARGRLEGPRGGAALRLGTCAPTRAGSRAATRAASSRCRRGSGRPASRP